MEHEDTRLPAPQHREPAAADWQQLIAAERAKNRTGFTPTPGVLFAAVTVAIALVAWAVSDDGWVPLLDSANLAFHEAGHPIFGILGSTLGLYGGTLGQLVFPITVIVTFWRREQAAGIAFGWIWLFENWLNIARYMADARAQVLPLVGGGEHDWLAIFSRWGVLAHDKDVAGFVQFCAWMGMLAVWLWAGRRWLARDDRS